MIPNFKSLFYRLLTSDTNVAVIERVFINKVISSFYEKYEPKIINKIYNTICPINQALDISTFLYKDILGLNEAYLKINCCKVHQRRVFFDDNLSCEVGDLIFVVEYELIMAKTTYCIDRRVTITQLKRRHKDGWKIDCTQFYLMRYWPKFIYKSREFDLKLFRLHPDVGSFYCLIDNYEDGFNYVFLRGNIQKYRTNSIFDSTFLMERSIGYIPIPNSKIIYDDPLYENANARYNAGFFLWRVILQDYGLPDLHAINLINLMCENKFLTNGSPESEHGLVIYVKVSLRGEMEKLLRKKFKSK